MIRSKKVHPHQRMAQPQGSLFISVPLWAGPSAAACCGSSVAALPAHPQEFQAFQQGATSTLKLRTKPHRGLLGWSAGDLHGPPFLLWAPRKPFNYSSPGGTSDPLCRLLSWGPDNHSLFVITEFHHGEPAEVCFICGFSPYNEPRYERAWITSQA